MAGSANPAMTKAGGGFGPRGYEKPRYMRQQTAAPNVAEPEQVAQPVQQLIPPTVTQSSGPSVYDQSAGAYSAALAGTGAAAAGPNIGQFMNPYTSMVTGQTLQDMERQRQMAVNQTAQQATQAGAFGGSRHGVAEALTNEAAMRQGAQAFANLQQQGFGQALGAAQQQQQLGLQAAGQMGNLSNLGFGFGQQITQNQMQQGQMQQAMQQALIDAAKGQWQGYTAQPGLSQQYLGQAIGVSPVPQTQTTTKNPGLFDYLTLAATAASGTNFASDPRLKTNVQPKGEFKGVKFYTWDWNEEGEKVAQPGQHKFGVMADELQRTHPHLVSKGKDGYLRVNYAQLSKELAEAA